MADTIDLQSDQFMTLLTDALRSGPGSPEWHEAVKLLRASNQNIDDYTLLYAARERLESGKAYRGVRAGAGFTRKVLTGIDEQGNVNGGVPTANLIAMIAAGAILAVVVTIGVLLFKGANPRQQAIEDLSTRIFGSKFLSASFSGTGGAALIHPEGWTTFGDLPLTAESNELRSSLIPSANGATTYQSGGLVIATGIPADRPLEVDVSARVNKSTENEIAEVFVSDEPITRENADGGHALVWQFKGGEARVFLADGRSVPQADKFPNVREFAVKLVLNRDTVIVESAGQRLYAGPHLLSPEKSRYAGIRFRRRAGDTADKADHFGITSISLQKP